MAPDPVGVYGTERQHQDYLTIAYPRLHKAFGSVNIILGVAFLLVEIVIVVLNPHYDWNVWIVYTSFCFCCGLILIMTGSLQVAMTIKRTKVCLVTAALVADIVSSGFLFVGLQVSDLMIIFQGIGLGFYKDNFITFKPLIMTLLYLVSFVLSIIHATFGCVEKYTLATKRKARKGREDAETAGEHLEMTTARHWWEDNN